MQAFFTIPKYQNPINRTFKILVITSSVSPELLQCKGRLQVNICNNTGETEEVVDFKTAWFSGMFANWRNLSA